MFRRSGSFASYAVEGPMPAPAQPAFVEALAAHRFRGIENAASEDESVGWVTPGDPTGETFEPQDVDFDAAVWLRMRIDKKRLPSKWVAIYRAAAEKSRGRPLSARERRELSDDLTRKLLPRVLPTVNLVDVLWVPKRGTLLLFATGRGVQEHFEKLFHQTFEAHLLPADPYYLAQRLAGGREARDHLEQLSPVRWPSGAGATRAPSDHGEPAAADGESEVAAGAEAS